MLRYGVMDNRGFLLLTGEVGTGKTILIQQLLTMMGPDMVIATLSDPDLDSLDFYGMVADGFKMNRTFHSKGAFLIHLRDFLHYTHAENKNVLLIIDECQRMNHDILEDIRMLSNIELHDHKLINFLFVGQQEFNAMLNEPRNRALAQRITIRYHIEALDPYEVEAYVEHRLEVAGNSQKLFSSEAIEAVHRYSGGIPRLINVLCDHLLLTGYARNLNQINLPIVVECANELRIPQEQSTREYSTLLPDKDSSDVSRASAPDAIKTMPESQAAVKDKRQPDVARDDGEKRAPFRSITAYSLYFFVLLLLAVSVPFIMTRFTGSGDLNWQSDDLTPSKYQVNLERREAELLERIEGPLAASNPAPADAGSKDSDMILLQSKTDGTDAANAGNDTGLAGTDTISEDHMEKLEASQVGHEPKVGKRIAPIAPLPLMKEKTIVYFSINSDEIESKSIPKLDQISTYLSAHPDQVVYVRGYTDSSGAPGLNETVSRYRAVAVKAYLIEKGAPADNIRVFAMGDAFPVASNKTLDGRRRNRRVEIEFLSR
ncbi:MAG: AAA family ATPase [Desulfatitalea sp.]|nr:AAA family ATPase [Desulfatitalea sp.]NNK00430.1 AAA family ATPase [Desulfatitalea sp.]